MADVTINYKGSTIAEMNGTATKTLKTSGKYCEGDITVSYAPRSKTYEFTLAQKSGWVELVTLDSDVLAHINDSTLVVSFSRISSYVYEYYSGCIYIAQNTPVGYQGAYPSYGLSHRMSGEEKLQDGPIFYPANNTGTSTSLGGLAAFRVSNGKYYLRAGDGYISTGDYRLTFTW